MEEFNIKQNIPNTNPFTVPDGYFEQLASDILARLPERPSAVVTPVSLWRRLSRPLIGVAASVCVAIFGVSIYLHSTRATSDTVAVSGSEASAERLYPSDNAADYIMVDNDDIYLYLCELDLQ